MRFNHYLTSLILGTSMLASGCASMLVHTNRPDAVIYLDGQRIGIGQAKVKSMGLPKTSVLRAEVDGKVVTQTVSRKFTLTTALLMPITYFTSAVWGWQYPSAAIMQFSEERSDGWDRHGGDVWSQPMHETSTSVRPPSASPPTPQPAGPNPWAQPMGPK